MSVFHYTSEPMGGYPFPGNSGAFLCSTTAVSGGTRSNGVLLQYRGTKSLKRFRDAVVIVFQGRAKPAVEQGQYNFSGVDAEFSFPDSNNNTAIGESLSGAEVEAKINSIINACQTGGFAEYQDSRGRHIVGTFTSDPVLTDLSVGWRQVSFSIVEVGTG